MTYLRNEALTGARAFLTLNGAFVGYAQTLSGNDTINRQTVYVLGSMYAVEHVPLTHQSSFNAGFVRLLSAHLKANNLWPRHSGDPAEYLSNVLVQNELEANIVDPTDGSLIFTIPRIAPASLNWNIDPNGVTIEQATFLAIKLLTNVE
jgi:hypothetical protein